jgi:hypothetical protein
MAFIEYVLVALLGSAGAAAPAATPGGGASTPVFNADSIAQPDGGVGGGYFQKKPGKEPRHDSEVKTSHRRHHKGRHHRHPRSLESGKKATRQ